MITRGLNEMLRLNAAIGGKAETLMGQADRHGIELPISSAVRAVLHGEITPAEGLQRLLSRDQKPEYPEGLFG
jgi:glycerol-3-phosphate dehydrogenase (NAD(P)+)